MENTKPKLCFACNEPMPANWHGEMCPFHSGIENWDETVQASPVEIIKQIVIDATRARNASSALKSGTE